MFRTCFECSSSRISGRRAQRLTDVCPNNDAIENVFIWTNYRNVLLPIRHRPACFLKNHNGKIVEAEWVRMFVTYKLKNGRIINKCYVNVAVSLIYKYELFQLVQWHLRYLGFTNAKYNSIGTYRIIILYRFTGSNSNGPLWSSDYNGLWPTHINISHIRSGGHSGKIICGTPISCVLF